MGRGPDRGCRPLIFSTPRAGVRCAGGHRESPLYCRPVVAPPTRCPLAGHDPMSPSAKRAGKKVGSARKRKAPARKSKPKKASARKPKARKASARKPRARKASARKPKARKAAARKPRARKAAARKPRARKAAARKPKARKAAAPKPKARKAPRKGPSSSSEKSKPTKPRARATGAGAKPRAEARTPSRSARHQGPQVGRAPSLPVEPIRNEATSGRPTVAPSGRSAGPPPESRPVPRAEETPEPHWDTIPLPDSKAQLKRYYHGAQMPSPMGGFLEPLRVRSEDGGVGTVILECSASSLRFALTIPGPTRGEKSAIKRKQEAREDPTCPRHDPQQRLNRVGQYLVCPLCGVRYGRV